MRIYAYLRSSTKEQDATRARESLKEFAKSKGLRISKYFIEQVSGASLARPELLNMLDTTDNGDAILIESVDRLTRLNQADWQTLKGLIESKGLKIIVLDCPTTHDLTNTGNWLTDEIMILLNKIILEMMASQSRTDYETRRKRQAEGIAKAKGKDPEKYKGRPVDQEKRKKIIKLLKANFSWKEIEKTVPCSSYTIAKVQKEMEGNSIQ